VRGGEFLRGAASRGRALSPAARGRWAGGARSPRRETGVRQLGKVAEVVSVGTELLMGQIVNTNAQFLAQALARHGVEHYFQTTVGDNLDRLVACLRQALGRSDLVVTIGGLGPTADDLTKEAVAAAVGVGMRLDEGIWEGIARRFRRRGQEPTPNNRRQAELPEGAIPIPNPHGTAPGVLLEAAGGTIVCLPGPPREFQPLVRDFLEPWLEGWVGGDRQVLQSRLLRVGGLGESAVEHRLADLMAAANPTVAPYAKPGEVHLRLTARAGTPEEAAGMLAPVEAEIRRRLDPWVFGADGEDIEQAVGQLLRERRLTLAVAESCTGGLLAGRITAVPGASDYFLLGVTPYDNRFKVAAAGVDPDVLAREGAVSEAVARQLAEGVRRLAGSDLGLGVTGIAGPGGGSAEKPVGTVWLALAADGGTWAHRLYWPAGRADVRLRAVQEVLVRLRLYLLRGGAGFNLD
jgi:nicotinamide-nucleotide amidase